MDTAEGLAGFQVPPVPVGRRGTGVSQRRAKQPPDVWVFLAYELVSVLKSSGITIGMWEDAPKRGPAGNTRKMAGHYSLLSQDARLQGEAGVSSLSGRSTGLRVVLKP